VIVFDDYAEKIQQNQVKTSIFPTVSRFFSKKGPFAAYFPGQIVGRARDDRWSLSDNSCSPPFAKLQQKPVRRPSHRLNKAYFRVHPVDGFSG
jgi:hypothetical protein